MASFNILGSCVCRDLFEFHSDCNHEIKHFLQSSSPLTWFAFKNKPKGTICMEELEFISKISNFQKKCVMNDYNNTVLEYYKNPTDYFILDLISLANSNLGKEVYVDGTDHYFTISSWFKKLYEHGMDNLFEDRRIEVVDRFNLLTPEMIQYIINEYVKWLIEEKKYKSSQIILIENKHVSWYTDQNYLYFYKNNHEKINDYLDQAYKAFESALPNCHVIKMPCNTHGDYFHRWSVYSLHFTKEYYDYLYECINNIVESNPELNEILRSDYSEMFGQKMETLVRNSFRHFLLGEKDNLLENPATGVILSKAYVANKNSDIYDDKSLLVKNETLPFFCQTHEMHSEYATIMLDNKEKYLKSENCICGYSGHNHKWNSWKTVNSCTLVQFKDNSIIIMHNGKKINGQTQIISTISDRINLADEVVTFSVEARVLKLNREDEKSGGSIALINATNYNKGKLYAKKDFKNQNWEKITLIKRLPSNDFYRGLTVVLRAVQGNCSSDTIVEFRNPSLEIGMLSSIAGV